jgi:hypothetical protein
MIQLPPSPVFSKFKNHALVRGKHFLIPQLPCKSSLRKVKWIQTEFTAYYQKHAPWMSKHQPPWNPYLTKYEQNAYLWNFLKLLGYWLSRLSAETQKKSREKKEKKEKKVLNIEGLLQKCVYQAFIIQNLDVWLLNWVWKYNLLTFDKLNILMYWCIWRSSNKQ